MVPLGFVDDSLLFCDRFGTPDAPYSLLLITHTLIRFNLHTQSEQIVGGYSMSWGDVQERDHDVDTLVPAEQSEPLETLNGNALYRYTLQYAPSSFVEQLAKIPQHKQAIQYGHFPLLYQGDSMDVQIHSLQEKNSSGAVVWTSQKYGTKRLAILESSQMEALSVCGYLLPKDQATYLAIIACEDLGDQNVGFKIFGAKLTP